MFDDPDSLRATARRYRRAASQTTDRDVVHVFTAVAEQYDQKAAALEIERVKGTSLRAWDSILRRQRIIQPADRLTGLGNG
jgi:hypothetical protein